tara:strand:+ start:398 stop:712 length:315 start_codon:yes stop_codon:yes gene_type:complete
MPLADVEVEASDVKEAVRKLSGYYDVFSETECGCCGSNDIAPVYRKAGGYDYYELTCRACTANLSFGQHQEGETLFPKRKLEDGTFDAHNRGWHKWQGNRESSF